MIQCFNSQNYFLIINDQDLKENIIYLYHRPVTRAFALRNDNSLSNEKYGREFPPIVYVSCFSCIL